MNTTDQIKNALHKKRVATIEELCSYTGKVAITVKQALAKLDYLSSYNHNSRFYTLRSICRFNKFGKKNISREFSLHGPHLPLMQNLKNDDYITAMIGQMKDIPLQLSWIIVIFLTIFRSSRKIGEENSFRSLTNGMVSVYCQDTFRPENLMSLLILQVNHFFYRSGLNVRQKQKDS